MSNYYVNGNSLTNIFQPFQSDASSNTNYLNNSTDLNTIFQQ